MKLAKFFVVLLVACAINCFAEIIVKTSESAEWTYFVEATVKIVTSCYQNEGRAVGFVGATSDVIVRAMSDRGVPVILMNEAVELKPNYFRHINRHRYRLNVFVLTISSLDDLAENIVRMERVVWWNHMASFLILYTPPDGICRNVEHLLFSCWRIGMIDPKVLCLAERRRLIFTYNLYTDRVPNNWTLVDKFKNRLSGKFILLRRLYNDDICDGLHWDKTKDLGGSAIDIFLFDESKHGASPTYTNMNRYDAKINNIINNICYVLNATVRNRIMDSTTVANIATMTGMIFSPHNLRTGSMYTITYPFEISGIVVMTQFRGHKTQLGKIYSVIDSDSRWGVLIVVIVTLMFFKFFLRQSVMTAVLNVFRLACGTGLTTIPDNLPPRLYLTAVFFFYVTVQAFYTGQLAALLTRNIPLRNVDNMNDLFDLGHKIYGHKAYGLSPLILYEQFLERFVPISTANCSSYVVNDPLAACLDEKDALLDEATELKLHLTADYVSTDYFVFVIRSNWIIEPKVNTILSWQFEADIHRPLNLRKVGKTLQDFQYDDEVKNNKEIKVMTLRELAFAFAILGIGLVCATVCFIAELAIARIRSRRATIAIEYLN